MPRKTFFFIVLFYCAKTIYTIAVGGAHGGAARRRLRKLTVFCHADEAFERTQHGVRPESVQICFDGF